MHSQKGFGIVEVIILLTVACLIGVSGWYVWQKTNGENQTKIEENYSPKTDTTQSRPSGPRIDNQLKNDAARVIARLNEYAANNNGRLPMTNAEIDRFESQYFANDFTNPETAKLYTINQLKANERHLVTYLTGVCNDDGSYRSPESSRDFIIQIELSDDSLHCLNV